MGPSTSDVLWIAPRWPFPADDGAKIATLRLLEPLRETGMPVHLIALPPQGERHQAPAPTGWRVERWERGQETPQATRRASLRTWAFWGEGLPYSIVPFRAAPLRARVRDLVASRAWSAIVVDGLHAAAALPDELPAPLVYRAHNVETDILARASTEGPRSLRAFLGWQARRMAVFEKKILQRAAFTAAVSDEDARRFCRLAPSARVPVVPIGWDFPAEPPPPRAGEIPWRLLFVGRLDWAPNREGLAEFLREVWTPLVQRATGRFELTIAGSGDGAWLEPFRGLRGVRILGRVAELPPLYLEADLCLVPLRFGSGTRVKVLEACRYARPCLSTSLGVEGLGFGEGDFLRADTSAEWRTVLEHLDRSDLASRGQCAFRHARERFSASRAAADFRELLRGISG